MVGDGPGSPSPAPSTSSTSSSSSTAYERITEVAAEAELSRLRIILDSTWARLRVHARAHRRNHDRSAPLRDGPSRLAAPSRTDAEELAPVLVDAVERRAAAPRRRPPRLHHPRQRPRPPPRSAATLDWVADSLVRRRHRVERVLAAEVLGEPRPAGLARGPLRLMPPPQAGGANNSQRRAPPLPGHRPRRPRRRLARGAAGPLLSGGHLSAGLAPTFHALTRLPANAAEPRLAWGPPWQAACPGAALYWACTAFAASWRSWPSPWPARSSDGAQSAPTTRKRLGSTPKPGWPRPATCGP